MNVHSQLQLIANHVIKNCIVIKAKEGLVLIVDQIYLRTDNNLRSDIINDLMQSTYF